jgi:hypothetical protein
LVNKYCLLIPDKCAPNHSPKHRSAKSRWSKGKDRVHLRSEQHIKEVMTRISNYRQLKVHLVRKNVRKILARMIEVKNTNDTEVKKIIVITVIFVYKKTLYIFGSYKYIKICTGRC